MCAPHWPIAEQRKYLRDCAGMRWVEKNCRIGLESHGIVDCLAGFWYRLRNQFSSSTKPVLADRHIITFQIGTAKSILLKPAALLSSIRRHDRKVIRYVASVNGP